MSRVLGRRGHKKEQVSNPRLRGTDAWSFQAIISSNRFERSASGAIAGWLQVLASYRWSVLMTYESLSSVIIAAIEGAGM